MFLTSTTVLLLAGLLVLLGTVSHQTSASVYYYGYYARPIISPYHRYRPSPSLATTPTMITSTPGAPFGIVTDVPFDPDDSFTNYDWSPPEEDSDVTTDSVPNYTFNPPGRHPLEPSITRGAARGRSLTRVPILPYDFNSVVMDANEDSFDGVSNARWDRPQREWMPPHESLRGPERPSDRSLFPPDELGPSRSNIPMGRRLGFDYLPTWLDTPAMERANRPREVDIDLGEYLLARRNLYNPPHYPGLQ